MLKRWITPRILDALADNPVVFLNGARQTGKSTLVQALSAKHYPARYLTLDDAGVLAAASADPAGFLAGLEGPTILDEVQRAPQLFLPLKAQVDRNRRPGRFLLTGSANVLLLPRLADSLAGRMEILTLWPLSQGEIDGMQDGFIDAVFSKKLAALSGSAETRKALLERALRGGYPEAIARASGERREAWFGSYLTAILQRDIRDLAQIEGLALLPRLLALLATRAGALLNVSDLSRSAVLPQSTLKRYLALLETTFLVQLLPAWSGNRGKRLVKAPKLFVVDSGLMAHLLGYTGPAPAEGPSAGALLENFAVMELRKQTAWSKTRVNLFHFRTSAGQEVDLVLEDAAGRVVGVEIKSSATIGDADFRGLRALAEQAGKAFQRGVLLYTGSASVPFGPALHALPMSAIWRLGAHSPHA
jgi:predicted AAA+ superfamily ATPase